VPDGAEAVGEELAVTIGLPGRHCRCWIATGKKLNLYLSAAKQVSGAVVYYEE
jgi:hypothetical protein